MTIFCLLMIIPVLITGSVAENCMSWAVRQRIIKGGTLLHRRSLFADNALTEERRKGFGYWLAKQVPHFVWADDEGTIWQYRVKPEFEEELKKKRLFIVWLYLWFYDGLVVKGDIILGDRIGTV